MMGGHSIWVGILRSQTRFALLVRGRVEDRCKPASWLSFLVGRADLPTGEGDRDRSRSRLCESAILCFCTYGDAASCGLRMPVF